MNDELKAPAAADPLLDEELRKRIVLEERLKLLSKPTKTRRIIFGTSLVCLAASVVFGILNRINGEAFKDTWFIDLLPWLLLLYVLFLLWVGQFFRSLNRAKIERELASKITTQKTEELQEKLDENFFTNLVKINFKYIDQYYLQTQVQADKSFLLCAIAACTSLLVIVAGIILLFCGKPVKKQ